MKLKILSIEIFLGLLIVLVGLFVAGYLTGIYVGSENTWHEILHHPQPTLTVLPNEGWDGTISFNITMGKWTTGNTDLDNIILTR